jgi:hypothetical protein
MISNSKQQQTKPKTTEEALIQWCKDTTEGYKDVQIEDLSTSWTSGLAFCALIHAHRPGLLDFETLSKDHPATNLEAAFSIAETHLGIPPLLVRILYLLCITD